jgi:hypothetical protein
MIMGDTRVLMSLTSARTGRELELARCFPTLSR